MDCSEVRVRSPAAARQWSLCPHLRRDLPSVTDMEEFALHPPVATNAGGTTSNLQAAGSSPARCEPVAQWESRRTVPQSFVVVVVGSRFIALCRRRHECQGNYTCRRFDSCPQRCGSSAGRAGTFPNQFVVASPVSTQTVSPVAGNECRSELHLLMVQVVGSSPTRPATWGGSSDGRAGKIRSVTFVVCGAGLSFGVGASLMAMLFGRQQAVSCIQLPRCATVLAHRPVFGDECRCEYMVPLTGWVQFPLLNVSGVPATGCRARTTLVTAGSFHRV